MVTLETERLILRMFREEDLNAYAEMVGDPEIARYLGTGQPMARWEAWRSLALMVGHWQFRGYGMFAVEERESGAMVGRVGPWYPEGWPSFEVGWTLRKQFWGNGYATEAARAAITYSFEQLNQPRIISLIRPENQNSIRVAERLGERIIGESEIMGHKAIIYGINREQWG